MTPARSVRAVPRDAATAVATPPPATRGFVGGLLGGVAAGAFIADLYGRRPFAAPQAARGAASVLDWQRFDELLAAHDDVLASRGGERVEGRWAGARAALAAGVALALRHVERRDRRLALLAAQAAADLCGDVDVQVHATPAGRAGFGWHVDPEEVFIVQCAGVKLWRLRANTVHADPLIEAMPSPPRFAAETSRVLECRLEPGDWLYVPSGWWHTTIAGEQDSLSLAIGVQAATPLMALDRLRRELATSPRWRRRLPPATRPGADEAWGEALAEVADELARRLRDPALRAALARDDRRRVRDLLADVG